MRSSTHPESAVMVMMPPQLVSFNVCRWVREESGVMSLMPYQAIDSLKSSCDRPVQDSAIALTSWSATYEPDRLREVS